MTIEKLDVTSASGFGIGIGLLNNVLGTVTIHQAPAHDNTFDGVFVVGRDGVSVSETQAISNASRGVTAISWEGGVSIQASKAISNGQVGVYVAATGSISVDGSTANENGQGSIGSGQNGGGGFILEQNDQSSCPETPYQFSITGSTADDNGGYGFDAKTYLGEIKIDDSHATGNAYSGFLVKQLNDSSCAADVTIMSSSADDNGWYEDDNRYGRDGFDVVNYIGDTTIPKTPAWPATTAMVYALPITATASGRISVLPTAVPTTMGTMGWSLGFAVASAKSGCWAMWRY